MVIKTNIKSGLRVHAPNRTFGSEAVAWGKEIIELLRKGSIHRAEVRLGERGLEAVAAVRVDPRAKDRYDEFFTYLEVELPDELRGRFSDTALEVLLEGDLLCCFGETYGTNLTRFKRYSKKIIKGSKR